VVLIRAGRVRLNGATRRDPEAPADLEQDRIEVDGRPVRTTAKFYLMLNKPRGVVTTASDEKGRETVYEFLKGQERWVAPVGRLDKASEGLLLLTNDTEWSARVLAPETHLDKVYQVQIGAIADEKLLTGIAKGVRTKDGDVLRLKSARILRQGGRNSWLEIVLDEGRNRHIRRVFEALRVEVLRLIRVAIGPLPLGQLPKGRVRALTVEEKEILDKAMKVVSPRQKGASGRHLSTADPR
jgi:23S rRNA pseudouridine2605 synthase